MELNREQVGVLVAEDSPTQAEQLRHMLQTHGYQVTLASNGNEAFDALLQRKPGIILSDILMPEMDGYGLCRKIKADRRFEDVPVLLLTSLSGPGDIIRALQCGADGFIRKPYNPSDLLARIQHVLANRYLRKTGNAQMGLEIYLGGQKHFINSERQQILGLLISTFEEAVQMNKSLREKQAELDRSLQFLNGLYGISEGLNLSTGEKEVAENALERALALPPVKAGWVVVRSGAADFRVLATKNVPAAMIATGMFDGDCFCRRELLSGELWETVRVYECERLKKLDSQTQRLRYRYHASVPLLAGGRALGVMNLVGAEQGMFNDEDLTTLHAVGSQVAVALERARLYQHLERKVEERTMALEAEIVERRRAEELLGQRYLELEALHQIGQRILNFQDMKPDLQLILEKAMAIGSFDLGNIRLLSRDGNTLETVASEGYRSLENAGVDRPRNKATEPWGRGFRVLNDRSARVVENVPQSDGFNGIKAEGAQSALVAPIRTVGGALGYLILGSRRPRRFHAEEIRLFETVGNQIGIAIQKAHLLEETRHSLEHVQALHKIDRAIMSTLDLRSVLDILLEKIEHLLPYPVVLTIMLIEEESNTLKPITCRNLDQQEWKDEVGEVIGIHTRNSVIRTQSPAVIANVQLNPGKGDPEFYRDHGMVSCMRVPLIAKEKSIGLLSLYTKEERQFATEEVEFLSSLAGQAAIAIHNAQLHEKTVQQTQELERANRVKDEFMGVMSHELRTPLTVVMGYTELLQQRLLGELNEEQVSAVNAIMTRSQDLLAVINSILETTRLAAAGVGVGFSRVRLEDLLDSLRGTYRNIDTKGLTLIWDYPPVLPEIITDALKLRQILENLINNAIKFTEEGCVTVSVGVREQWQGAGRQGAEGDLRCLEFKVIDTGIGIAKEAQSYIFERFRQVDSSDTRSHGGVGMGLFIAKTYAKLLRGKIGVESQPGKGSTFIVTLPLEPQRL